MADSIKSFSPPDVGDDAHIIRRLGRAVVKQWSRLTPETHARIREQAALTEDRHLTAQLDQRIGDFINEHGWGKNA